MSTSQSTIERLSSHVITLATVIALGLLVEARVRPQRATGAALRVERLDNWDSLKRGALVSLGELGRPVEITVFTDFQCPFCRVMDSVLTVLDERFPGKLSRGIVHYPLPSHPHAIGAAVAFECAASVTGALNVHRALYARQATLGSMPWHEVALPVNADTSNFGRCVAGQPNPRIQQGSQLAQRLKLSGTPAVVVNGWLFDPGLPGPVSEAVERAVNGKSPKP